MLKKFPYYMYYACPPSWGGGGEYSTDIWVEVSC